jgi:hypothetical protein
MFGLSLPIATTAVALAGGQVFIDVLLVPPEIPYREIINLRCGGQFGVSVRYDPAKHMANGSRVRSSDDAIVVPYARNKETDDIWLETLRIEWDVRGPQYPRYTLFLWWSPYDDMESAPVVVDYGLCRILPPQWPPR